MNHRILTLALCVLTAPAWTAAPKTGAILRPSTKKPIPQPLAGRWQGIDDRGLSVEFNPSSSTTGRITYLRDGKKYARPFYRLEPGKRITFPEKGYEVYFSLEKGILSLLDPKGSPVQRFRRVKSAQTKTKK
jgi:hypothetical protein